MKQRPSIGRILVLIVIILLGLNSIKIPPDEMPIITVSFLEVEAKTTPFAIFTKHEKIPNHILEHEKCHVKQMHRYGSLWLVAINTYYLAKYGYWDNPFEIEARNGC